MEIEKKFLIAQMPEDIDSFEKKEIEQAYLCKNPIVRIRKSNENYILTYKSKFGLEDKPDRSAKVCNEVELPLTKEGYLHLKEKADGKIITKTRYLVPVAAGLTAEVDIFHGYLEGLEFLEVEFRTEEEANSFEPPAWFGEDVSLDKRYSNNYLSTVKSFSDL
ncbi:hypothetical protein lbkm_1881 [Lachnospiraceae bacterium KM106-2]|nr:hypothetical protein lbkm_1881 [Lachnospiraceae bacterium KM106-2]